MRKVMNTERDRSNYRRHLLASASAIALLGSVYGTSRAAASDDADRPPVWVEFGAQFEHANGLGDIFAPAFVTTGAWKADSLTSPAATQKMNSYSFGGEGSISFQPDESDWIFSAGVRYGRLRDSKHRHDQPEGPRIAYNFGNFFGKNGYITNPRWDFEDTVASTSEAHTILDFQAGKDVGLGIFGEDGSSVVSAGIRFAQFRSGSSADIHARLKEGTFNALPSYFPHSKYLPAAHHNDYAIPSAHSERNFQGIGPSISLKETTPLAGNAQNGEITLDWGVNGAVLFGRQKAKVAHKTTGWYFVSKYHNGFSSGYHTLYKRNIVRSRQKSIVVPSVGATAALSFRYADAKITLGYRGDWFFGAVDGGIDTRKSTTRGFQGPFASISIGVGD